jgi:hypothetical protein
LIDSITTRDLPVIQATVLVIATATVFFNIVADLLTIYATPKLRTGYAERRESTVNISGAPPIDAVTEARSELPTV